MIKLNGFKELRNFLNKFELTNESTEQFGYKMLNNLLEEVEEFTVDLDIQNKTLEVFAIGCTSFVLDYYCVEASELN